MNKNFSISLEDSFFHEATGIRAVIAQSANGVHLRLSIPQGTEVFIDEGGPKEIAVVEDDGGYIREL